jgi:hypothetical protein
MAARASRDPFRSEIGSYLYCYFVDKYTLWWLGCFLRDTFLQMDLMYLEAKFGVSILAT